MEVKKKLQVREIYGGCELINKDIKMEDIFHYFDYIGCVYPNSEQSYYIQSNIQERLTYITCSNGSFFGDLSSLENNFDIVEKYDYSKFQKDKFEEEEIIEG